MYLSIYPWFYIRHDLLSTRCGPTRTHSVINGLVRWEKWSEMSHLLQFLHINSWNKICLEINLHLQLYATYSLQESYFILSVQKKNTTGRPSQHETITQ